jgi:hypothetical protein
MAQKAEGKSSSGGGPNVPTCCSNVRTLRLQSVRLLFLLTLISLHVLLQFCELWAGNDVFRSFHVGGVHGV